ncbi:MULTISPECIES: hypothetical protein [Marinitoga]|uniref:hypothetical protein n=1 Tax=Marinitoga TaxID=160798 RepID=UPI0002E44CD3|nr:MULTISPECIES: hypothetical protein [Marinitoga]APT76035.1 hypothetical protein LN42_06300 [Marinitoga sp. 1137]NUU97699.1 hypothetical protein [Marinitoga sp. 1138]
MYKEILSTLYTFLGKNIVEEEKKVKSEIFDKLTTKDDFYEILEYLKSETFPEEVERKFLSLFIISLFERLRIAADMENEVLIYGNEKINMKNLNLDKSIVEIEPFLYEMIELIEYENLPTEILFGILSNDLAIRIKYFKELIKGSKVMEEKWSENELKGLVNSLTDSTREFLRYMVKVGSSSKDEIIKELNLKDSRSISAFTSAISRNSPHNKEKIIYGEKGKIYLNGKYREILNKILA